MPNIREIEIHCVGLYFDDDRYGFQEKIHQKVRNT